MNSVFAKFPHYHVLIPIVLLYPIRFFHLKFWTLVKPKIALKNNILIRHNIFHDVCVIIFICLFIVFII